MPKTTAVLKRNEKKREEPKRPQRLQWNLVTFSYILVVCIIFLSAAKLYFVNRQFDQVLPKDSYQAVFLTNGQVYFGHLQPLSRSLWELTDVYYIQEQSQTESQQLQDTQGQENTATEETQQQGDTQFSIVRLGNELHQPMNQLVINKEHVLFWETLQSNSRVIEAIQKEKQ
ncbi:MAG TPA: hypothetical protein VJB65_03650 [Patescibacteria group bacterium]|nr:hypothetical protein [Patescibacteria group bacterium]